MTAERRVERLEASLTPVQRVVAWIDEAHASGCLSAYVDSLLDQPPDAYPINRLAREAADAVRSGSRRRTEEVETAVRTAVRATVFRFELVMRINTVAHDMLVLETLHYTVSASQAALLAMEVREEPRAARDHLRRLATLRDFAASRADELVAAGQARSVVEARYLDGRPALFPDDAQRWRETLACASELVVMIERLAELDGVEPATSPPREGDQTRVASLVAELVEPAKVTALEKLDEGQRAFTIATAWLRDWVLSSRDVIDDSTPAESTL
jgi:hypothetical protein